MAVSGADAIARCARILFNLTKGWRAADGSAQTLADARAMLAATIYALDGAGFPPPASDDLVNQPALKDVWSGCVAAARTARDSDDRPKAPEGLHVLLWRPDPNDGNKPDRTGLDLQWPLAEGSRVKRCGLRVNSRATQ